MLQGKFLEERYSCKMTALKVKKSINNRKNKSNNKINHANVESVKSRNEELYNILKVNIWGVTPLQSACCILEALGLIPQMAYISIKTTTHNKNAPSIDVF